MAGFRSLLYVLARLLGDINAVTRCRDSKVGSGRFRSITRAACLSSGLVENDAVVVEEGFVGGVDPAEAEGLAQPQGVEGGGLD